MRKIKTLKANEEIHAAFVSRYENLLDKFNLLDKEHGELKKLHEEIELKFENLQSSSYVSIPYVIPCAIPIRIYLL